MPDEGDLPGGQHQAAGRIEHAGVEDYKEFWYSLVGLDSLGQDFDGNGPFAKFLVGNSGQTLRSQPASILGTKLKGAPLLTRSPLTPLGTRPAYPAEEPPYEPHVACDTQTLPNFNGPLSKGPRTGAARMTPTDSHEGGLSVRDQIERYRTAFIAVVTMILIAAVVGGYILAHENLKLPGWVPVLGRSFYSLKAEFQTAQAVTPGQGQAVTIAGAKIGEIASVNLHDGVAIVSMNVVPKYGKYIYRNATLLLRPKTQLQDITVEVSPGTPSAGRLHSGEVLPLSQTAANVDFDEFLAGLDAETRAYVQELIAGLGIGLKGNGRTLSADLRRFDPTAQLAKKIAQQLEIRHANIARSIHNFRAAGRSRRRQGPAALAAGRRLQRRVRHVLQGGRELPGNARAAAGGAAQDGDRSRQARDRHESARPDVEGARAVRARARPRQRSHPPAGEGDDADHQERRAAVRARNPARRQRTGSRDQQLGEAFPKLASGFSVFNEFFNEIAYNPGPSKGGFLFFLDWGNHDLNSVLSTADAHGALGRRLSVLQLRNPGILKSVSEINPTVNLLREPAQASDQGRMRQRGRPVKAARPPRRERRSRAKAPAGGPFSNLGQQPFGGKG